MDRLLFAIMKSILVVFVVGAVVAIGVAQQPAQAPVVAPMPEILKAYSPVTDDRLKSPADGDWLMIRRSYDGWGYSPLDQINRDNVSDLQMIWTRALRPGSQQGTPLAYRRSGCTSSAPARRRS